MFVAASWLFIEPFEVCTLSKRATGLRFMADRADVKALEKYLIPLPSKARSSLELIITGIGLAAALRILARAAKDNEQASP